MDTKRIRLILNLLVIEKIVQHSVVTTAFVFDIGNIRDEVAVDYKILMISGMTVGLLFAVSLWGMFKDRKWAINLIAALALFDFVGEFFAQGKVMITCTVSFVVAFVLLVLAYQYRKRVEDIALEHTAM